MNTVIVVSRASAYKKPGSLEYERQKRSFLATLANGFPFVRRLHLDRYRGCDRSEHVGGRELCGADSTRGCTLASRFFLDI